MTDIVKTQIERVVTIVIGADGKIARAHQSTLFALMQGETELSRTGSGAEDIYPVRPADDARPADVAALAQLQFARCADLPALLAALATDLNAQIASAQAAAEDLARAEAAAAEAASTSPAAAQNP